jgi:hypothetical protein
MPGLHTMKWLCLLPPLNMRKQLPQLMHGCESLAQGQHVSGTLF